MVSFFRRAQHILHTSLHIHIFHVTNDLLPDSLSYRERHRVRERRRERENRRERESERERERIRERLADREKARYCETL